MSSRLTPDIALANLQATALTARCHNAFFQQEQLKALHDTLRIRASAIKDAIKQDTHVSDEEATAEVAFGLSTITEHYHSIDAKKELEKEYSINHSKDAGDSTKPWGVVFIEPQRSHTPFFSVIAALSAALTAGNCVALKASNTCLQFKQCTD
jgi:acyl-CoA reductase-like NAD-dependent aldehyde dehydrogenase